MILIPEHLEIETINGVCTARCIMCSIESWERKPNTMSCITFEKILKKFVQFKDYIKFLSLFGCGEPLLDKELPEKIAIAKKLGFKGTGFATNCTELTEEKAIKLMKVNLDTIICSIDGFKKETHEAIRVGTNFEEVKSNVENFIRLRDEYGYNTRVLLRIILQESNKMEYPAYENYWSEKINPTLGDGILKFHVHNCGDRIDNFDSIDINKDSQIIASFCKEVFERMFIYSNGEVPLCCSDDNGDFKQGNILDEDPLKIFNNENFNHYRTMMLEGRIKELKYCANCSIARSYFLKKL